MPPRSPPRADEAAPLLAPSASPQRQRRRPCASSEPNAPAGTARFPFHPCARATPRWRKLFFRFFDGHRRVESLADGDVWPLESAPPVRGGAGLLRALWAANRRRVLWMSVWNAVALALSLVRPLLLLRLSTVGIPSESEAMSTSDMVGPVVGVVAAELALDLVSSHSHHNALRVSLQVSQSLSKVVVNKMIAPDPLRPAGHADAVSGHKERLVRMTSTVSSDLQAVFYCVLFARELCAFIVRLIVSMAVLVSVVDISWPILAGAVALFAVVLGAQATMGESLSKKASTLHVSWLKTLFDSLKSIQMTKLSAWEDKLQAKIERMRSEERRAAINSHRFWLFRTQLLLEAPLWLAVLAFSSESASLTPARALTALVLFRDCRVVAASLVPGLRITLGGIAAWRRVDAFVVCEFHHPRTSPGAPTSSESPTQSTDQYLAKMEGVCLSPASRSMSAPALLLDVHWMLNRGDLVVIHGAAGLGKSTLLAALRRDSSVARVTVGEVRGVPHGCRIAFCSQDPWLQALSIRENILFGTVFVEDKYWAVVDACGLLEDLAALPFGDATVVSPRGINLSSGQSARIALARACYADADLYLLDCPLANVDPVVQSEIFRKCIVELLMFKTVVIVTHNPEYIGSSYVDEVVEVKPLTAHVTSRPRVTSHAKSMRPSGICVNRRSRDYHHELAATADRRGVLRIGTLSRDAQQAKAQIRSMKSIPSSRPKMLSASSTTAISTLTLAEYLLGGGKMSLGWLLAAVVLYVMWVVASIAKDVLLVEWATTALGSRASDQADNAVATRYGSLVFAGFTLSVGAAMCMVAFNAASIDRLFQRTTHALLHATMTFYYRTRIGEILNRFQRDMETAHSSLPVHLSLLVMGTVEVLSRVAVFGWILGPLGAAVTSLGYWLVLRCVAVRFSQQLIRLTNEAHADQMNLLTEAIDGEPVLRAFGVDCVARFVDAFEQVNERLLRLTYMSDMFNGHMMLQAGAALAVLGFSQLALLAVSSVTPTKLMLGLYYVLTATEDLVPRFRAGFTHSWDGLYNVERLRQFYAIETDVDTTSSKAWERVHGSWPPTGQLTFEHVSFSYTQSSPVALRDVTFTLHGGEKIGVVGRTGSGKSSLAMALLRVHPLRSGRISLDGVDLRTVPLTQLRRSVTMIPQSPTFYRCSVRDYLDPFHEFDDARLWRELLTVELGTRVQSLEEELLDNGENWSLGQRQLLCFARALLKPSRVVVLDEAFSCVDQACQEKILRVLGGRFASSTVVLITHRLDQILAFDRILVMRGGRVVESGSASELASDASSVFYEFLETSLLTL